MLKANADDDDEDGDDDDDDGDEDDDDDDDDGDILLMLQINCYAPHRVYAITHFPTAITYAVRDAKKLRGSCPHQHVSSSISGILSSLSHLFWWH